MKKISVLFVCMGNICRSPSAEGAFSGLVQAEGLSDQISIDSAGTHAYHVGESPDQRSQMVAMDRGLNLSKQKARKITLDDFSHFDYIIAMDDSNYHDLEIMQKNTLGQAKLSMMMSFSSDLEQNVPDPYYGGDKGFEIVLDLVEDASMGLLKLIKQTHF